MPWEQQIVQVSKWGNSLAIRLPASVVDALELREGDDIEVVIADDRVFQVRKKPGSADHLAKLRRFRGRLPADFNFDRDDINDRA
ncbi:transcriptional regulator/antitoxin, MazE [Cupriavidus basilensis OR16]|uniref:Transcriptional regulator/antitoxin, MazE n=1 Tax=Cupriavidus basilensis OR16 TaxID=1127483 RepID=H1SI99_9BURK|nr:transcriptional regulator/antitoxin, MazE [Cupriavidus basilensis OR16]